MTKIVPPPSPNAGSLSDCGGNQSVRLKSFAKSLLKTAVFAGTFQEKRFVEPLGDYRDVIRIDAGETDFIENLVIAKRRVEEADGKRWIGITSPNTIGAPVGYCLWVALQQQQQHQTLLGRYWFKVKSVELRNDEFRLRVEILRPFVDQKTGNANVQFDVKDYINEVYNGFKINIKHFAWNVATINNFRQATIFILVLVATLVTAAAKGFNDAMTYLLEFIKVTSQLVRAVTPIVVTTIRGVENIVNTVIKSVAFIIYGQTARGRPPARLQDGGGGGSYRALQNARLQLTAGPTQRSSVVIREIYE